MKNVYVPSLPTLPDYDDYCNLIQSIWDNNFLTNFGPLHNRFQGELSTYMGADHLSLFVNGHSALETALILLDKPGGEIITTPFTFASTAQAIVRCGFKPIYCDIDPETYNIDHTLIEKYITTDTVAILGVHVFGNPCYPSELSALADKHNIKLIFDAAHAVGVSYKDRPIAAYGDMSVFSLHATKVLNSIEGGALTVRTPQELSKAQQIQNFGIPSEEGMPWCLGLNGKMNEFQAAMGILNLRGLSNGLSCRKALYDHYLALLSGKRGVGFQKILAQTDYNYSYFTISIDSTQQNCNRDELMSRLAKAGIVSRKYFFPLCSDNIAPPISTSHLTHSRCLADSIIALPLHESLAVSDIEFIVRSMDLD